MGYINDEVSVTQGREGSLVSCFLLLSFFFLSGSLGNLS